MWRKALWLIPLLLAAVVMVLWRRRDPIAFMRTEFEVIDTRAKTKKVMASKGAAIARARIDTEFRDTMKAMDDEQKKQADRLRGDPDLLAAFLVRVASKR